MKTILQERRLSAGVSLRELSGALGWGFSIATLNKAEREVIRLSAWKEATILEVIERLAPLSGRRKRIVETAREIDFAEYCGDIRQRAASLHVMA